MDIINKGFLEVKSKANLRQLTKNEAKELDTIKLSTFLSLDPMCELSNENIHKALSSKINIPTEYKHLRDSKLTSEAYKKNITAIYIERFLSRNRDF